MARTLTRSSTPEGMDVGGAEEFPLPPPPLWAVISSGILTVLGLADSAYLTYVHYSGNLKDLHCTLGKFDCAKVVTSSYSVVFGIPVPVLGLLFFVGMAGLCSPWAWRSGWSVILWARVASTVVGVGMISYLIYVELYKLDTICPWCTSVHVMTFLLFLITIFATVKMTSDRYEV